MDTQRSRTRIAVIGSGLAGLTAVHLLSSSADCDSEVHLFEKASSIGMDSASIDVQGKDGRMHRVDSPMRALQSGELTCLPLLAPFLWAESRRD